MLPLIRTRALLSLLVCTSCLLLYSAASAGDGTDTTRSTNDESAMQKDVRAQVGRPAPPLIRHSYILLQGHLMTYRQEPAAAVAAAAALLEEPQGDVSDGGSRAASVSEAAAAAVPSAAAAAAPAAEPEADG